MTHLTNVLRQLGDDFGVSSAVEPFSASERRLLERMGLVASCRSWRGQNAREGQTDRLFRDKDVATARADCNAPTIGIAAGVGPSERDQTEPPSHRLPSATAPTASCDSQPSINTRQDVSACGYQWQPLRTNGSVICIVNSQSVAQHSQVAQLRQLRRLAIRIAAALSGRTLIVGTTAEPLSGAPSLNSSSADIRRSVQERIRRRIALAEDAQPSNNEAMYEIPAPITLSDAGRNLPRIIHFLASCRDEFDLSLIAVDADAVGRHSELLMRSDGVYLLLEAGVDSGRRVTQLIHGLRGRNVSLQGGLFVDRCRPTDCAAA